MATLHTIQPSKKRPGGPVLIVRSDVASESTHYTPHSAAKALYAATNEEIAAGLTRVPFVYFTHEVMTELEGLLRSTSLQNYAFVMKLVVQEFDGEAVNDIDAKRIDRARARLGKNYRMLATNLINRTLFRAVEHGILASHPALDLERSALPDTTRALRRNAPTRDRFPSPQVLAFILKNVPDDEMGDSVHLAGVAGLRPSEFMALSFDGVLGDNNAVDMNRTLTHPAGGKTSASNRFAAMPNQLVSRLRFRFEARQADVADLVIRDAEGKAIPRCELLRRFQDWQISVGIGKRIPPRAIGSKPRFEGVYTFRDLRHAAVAFMIWAGVDVADIAISIGHGHSQITLDRYAYLFDAYYSGQPSW